ncbi:MAG TPA: DNA polymerase III subunit alpha [Cyclobacteriaceae bacterium]|jgi:DNA polymerase-3 subunit alpha|nr:DNA polymerase III subunit alpha [Cyclobacteriaceae bacterium]
MYLNCHTGFSFKYGTLPIRALFNEAKRCGIHKLALTEINNVASYLEMLRLCHENKPRHGGLTKYGKPGYDLAIAVGIEFRTKDNSLLYIALAKNNRGFEKLNRFLSYHNREDKKLPERAPQLDDVFFLYPSKKILPEQLLPNEFIGVKWGELNAYSTHPSKASFAEKFVAWQPVTFLPPEKIEDRVTKKIKTVYRDHNAHRLLRCIANNTLLSKLPVHQEADREEFMLSGVELQNRFENFPELLVNANHLLAQCSIECELGVDKNKLSFYDNVEQDMKFLREKTRDGYEKIYAKQDTSKRIWNERIEKELAIIALKKFTSYYLITLDLIDYSKSKGFDFVGRGSGANSTVAYCLGITNVDPIELDLYFERFLNEERVSPPDFDIDFSWDNRDAIYEYLFRKHGTDHVCLLGTHVTYQMKSILRELAKVFGLPKEEIDDLVEGRHQETSRDHIAEKVMAYARYIVDKELPSNLSIHAGGVLITEKSIYNYTATEFPPKSLPVSQFEMHAAEDFGIYKFDILSQRGLGHIKETVSHIKKNRNVDVDVYQFKNFKEDETIKTLMRTGKTMGCFYVESPATRMLLGKLRCDDYLTLVAASSIIRPGVASSGMMQAYIERFHKTRNGIPYESIHPKMDEIMHDTYGVMVYQEDVIKVAHYFAGLTLTEADVLRRGMSGKYRSREEFQRVKDRFFEGCHERGYDQKVTDRVWYEIESFAGYSFAKGHSASYAVESYQSLFLKAHFPLEFMVGVINNFGGFYKTEFYFHEAKMQGADIQLPCVNKSNYLTAIFGNQIYVGFVHLKSLETKVGHEIVAERNRRGLFKSLNDFLTRVALGLEQVRILIRIGAFRFTNKNKQRLLWESMLFFSEVKERFATSANLFDTEPTEYPMPEFDRDEVEDAFDEIELLGFSLDDPFRLLATRDYGNVSARLLPNKGGTGVTIVGYLVTTKDTRTKRGQSMHFGTFLDSNGEVFDTVHFPEVASRFPFRGRGFYQIHGKVVEDFGVWVINVASMNKLPLINKKQLPAERFEREAPSGQ